MVGNAEHGAAIRPAVRKVPLSNPARRREVLDAVLALLAEVGYERMTMDLVAQRARASKATIYQRWPTKARLAVDAIEQHRSRPADRNTGSFVEDLRHLLSSWLASWTALDRGVSIALIEGSRGDAELARLRRERLRRPLQEVAELIAARACARAELPAGIDALLLMEMAFAVVLTGLLIEEDVPDGGVVDRIVDDLLSGVNPAQPTKGAVPSNARA